MAKNKRDIDAHIKRAHIVQQATALWLSQGFDETSMAAIARAAGIAPNTIYWYFAGKDELLLATMDAVNPELAEGYVQSLLPTPYERLVWLIEQLQRYRPLILAVHTRLAHSPLVRAWHERYHAQLESLLTGTLVQRGVAAERATTMATIGTFVIEGLLSHPHTAIQQQAILQFLANEV